MSALVIALAMVAIFATAATTALVLTRASRERVIRARIAEDIREHAAEVARFRPNGDYARGMTTAARIAEGVTFRVSPGFVSRDGSGNVRPAGDYRRSS